MTANINTYYENALLSEAAYVSLDYGMSKEELIEALYDGGMEQNLAAIFADKFSIVDQYTDPSTGLSATIFKKIDGGKLYFSMRGTEFLDDSFPYVDNIDLNDIFGADLDIVKTGVARDQIMSLYNYYQRLITPDTAMATQYRMVETAIMPTSGQYYETTRLSSVGALPYTAYVYLEEYTAAGIADPANGITSSTVFSAAGHSLGGHIAIAFKRLFSANVDAVNIYNSAGFLPNQEVEDFFGLFSGVQGFFDSTIINNVYAEKGPEIVTNSVVHVQFGDRIPAFTEEGSHSIKGLTDSFAVYNLLATLDSDASLPIEDLTPILQGADYYDPNILESWFGSSTNNSLENIVNAMGDLFDPAGNKVTPENRDGLYERIKAIQDSALYSNNKGELSVVSTAGVTDEAQTDLAYRYAVVNLNPFAILGDDTLYAQFETELALYNPASRTGNLTENYITDKSYFLNQLVEYNRSDDDDTVSANSTEYFFDYQSYSEINHDLKTNNINASRYIFADDKGKKLAGGEGADRLYGGAGNDILMETEYPGSDTSDDYLEGGAGNDSYYVGGGDTLFDTDGQGTVFVTRDNGMIYTLTGGRMQDGSYISDDQIATYVLNGTTLTVQVQGVNDAITVENFKDGDLGVNLLPESDIPELPTDFANTIIGDFAPLDFDLTQDGIQTEVDDLGNIILDMSSPGVRNDPVGGSDLNDEFNTGGGEDTVIARGGDDHVLAGSGNDYVQGGDGNDFIEGGEGNDYLRGSDGMDTIYGGADTDYIYGENGNDIIVGGDGQDRLCGREGDDKLYATAKIDLSAMLEPDSTETSDNREWLNAAGGNDLLVGGAGQDALFGGGGQDFIIAGPGDDFIGGDTDLHIEDALSSEWTVTKSSNGYEFSTVTNGISSGDAAGDIIYAGSGNDNVWGGGGDDVIHGDSGDDTITGDEGSDTLLGGSEDDELYGDSDDSIPDLHGNDYLDGGAGDDTLVGVGGNDTLIGGEGDDTLVGDASDLDGINHGDDYLDGGAGDDFLYGNAMGDTLIGGAGGDKLYGDSPSDAPELHGNDILYGGSGEDELMGSGGNDTLYGGSETDILFGDADDLSEEYHGNDVLYGGAGNDTLKGQGGDDRLIGGIGEDILFGDGGTFQGDDILEGGAGNDELVGGSGDDVLYGNSDNDKLWGEDGFDTLNGGQGLDILWGGVATTPWTVAPIMMAWPVAKAMIPIFSDWVQVLMLFMMKRVARTLLNLLGLTQPMPESHTVMVGLRYHLIQQRSIRWVIAVE